MINKAIKTMRGRMGIDVYFVLFVHIANAGWLTFKKDTHYTSNFNFYRPPMKLMFSVICVCQSVCPHGVPSDHYPWCIGPHCTGNPMALGPQTWDLTVHRPTPSASTQDIGPHCTETLLVLAHWSQSPGMFKLAQPRPQCAGPLC